MRDGKIQRTENVPRSKKVEIQQKLDSNLRDMGIHKLSDEGAGRKIAFKSTEVRKPQSYTTYSSRLDDNPKEIVTNSTNSTTSTTSANSTTSGPPIIVHPALLKRESQLELLAN